MFTPVAAIQGLSACPWHTVQPGGSDWPGGIISGTSA
jgi:hypothetical protein